MLKEVKIELTNKCSRNCKHCSSNATSSIGNLKILDFEDVSRVIKEAKLMGADTIVFTGGEPLMYDRLSELVELTSKLGIKSAIYTFAYRPDDTLNKYLDEQRRDELICQRCIQILSHVATCSTYIHSILDEDVIVLLVSAISLFEMNADLTYATYMLLHYICTCYWKCLYWILN